jgi:hypothetical protein
MRSILNSLLLTSLGFTRKTMAIEAGLNRPETTAAVEQRLSSRMRDPILIDFVTRLRRERTAVELPRILARMLGGGRWLRNMFSHAQFDDLGVNAQTMREFVNAERIEAVRIGDRSKNTGSEIRPVIELRRNSGPPIATIDTYFLYLPVGNRPARLVDDMSVALYLRRRKTMMQMSVINIITVLVTASLLFAGQFQTTNAGIGVGTVVIWIAGPFWLLHWLLVRPVLNRFELFPGFQSWLAGPHHQSTRFVREDRIGHIRFAEEGVTGKSVLDPRTLDRLGRNVKGVFLTSRGKIASLRDGTALAVIGNEIRRFGSIADYRDAYGDRALWAELTTKVSKRDFYREVAAALREIAG